MNINKKRLGIVGAISIIFVLLISVFIFTFTQMGPYDKDNKEVWKYETEKQLNEQFSDLEKIGITINIHKLSNKALIIPLSIKLEKIFLNIVIT